MTISIPGDQPRVLPHTLVKPPMAAAPVSTALQACNFLWQNYRPPLVDACPSRSFTASTVAQRYVTPVYDVGRLALVHAMTATVETSTTATVTLEVEYATAWVSIGGTTWTSLGSDSGSINGVGTLTVSASIPANAIALRWKFTSSTGNYTVHHVIAYPDDDTITSDGKQGGFVAYDDALLEGPAGAPVTTEMLNRVQGNLWELRRTRPHAALSYVQPESSTYGQAPTAVAALTQHTVARARIWMGMRQTATLAVRVIGASTGGTLTVAQVATGEGYVATESSTANLSGSITGFQIALTAQGAGVLRYADVDVRIYGGSSGSATLYSLHGWLPGE